MMSDNGGIDGSNMMDIQQAPSANLEAMLVDLLTDLFLLDVRIESGIEDGDIDEEGYRQHRENLALIITEITAVLAHRKLKAIEAGEEVEGVQIKFVGTMSDMLENLYTESLGGVEEGGDNHDTDEE